ncbi:SiaB family protein kinase [Paenibacillus hodogayensis]|uniref:SiaB family protein kinase n=1 Tax=Paenibacillus hodogayensis TaxID=279208 RepID=A0ABV5VVG0_9BACL
MIHTLLHIQNVLRDNGILISFAGRLSQGLIEEYGTAVKSYLETEQRPRNEIFDIFSIFIEQTQNIKNYCSVKEQSPFSDTIANSCIVTIGKTAGGYYVCSGNVVDNTELGTLVSRIDALVPLDKTALRRLYKEKLREDPPTGCTGAGVGLIDIARKSREPLEYTVTELDGHLSFFTLKAIV